MSDHFKSDLQLLKWPPHLLATPDTHHSVSHIRFMHAVTHSLAHRAQPATRTRVRWQPYHRDSVLSSASSTTSRSPPTAYLNTPASSVTSSLPPATPVCEIERLRHAPPSAALQTPRDTQFRDIHKNKHAMGLVGWSSTHLSVSTAFTPIG